MLMLALIQFAYSSRKPTYLLTLMDLLLACRAQWYNEPWFLDLIELL